MDAWQSPTCHVVCVMLPADVGVNCLLIPLFTLRTDDPKDEKSIGPQIVLDLAEAFLLPGIKDSIEERTSELLDQYVNLGQRLNAAGRAENFHKLSDTAKNYIGGITGINQKEKDATVRYIDQLIDDTDAAAADNAGDNTRALFFKIQNYGGYRGVRWVLSKARKKGLD
jgi:hypothetical protein